VNVTVADVGPCKKLLTFEIDAEVVGQAFVEAEKNFRKHAAVPGFRPGKAPAEMVLKRYANEIKEEAKNKLIADNYKKGLKEQNLEVLRVLNLEEVQFDRGQPMKFVVTAETEPQFELPEYRGLPAKREQVSVTEADVARALEALQEQRASFVKVDRPVSQGDFVVVNYVGRCEGRPIAELAPASRGLAEQKAFWIEIKSDSFLPGFAEQLVGAHVGDKRTVTVEFPAQFPVAPLAGKKAAYEVDIVEVKEKALPPLDDAFAKSWEAESLEKLRAGVRGDLQHELNTKTKRSIRNQVVRAVLDRVSFELPESYVQDETRAVVYDLVQENQQRGVSKEIIEQQKDEIYAYATQSAKERVKASFLFTKIAQKEGIRVAPEAINARIAALARAANKPAQQYFKELEKGGGLQAIVQQLLHEKVVDFLQENARIEDAPPGTNPAT
jgi:trigger factor